MKAPSNPPERQPLLSSPRIFILIDYRCSPLFGKCLPSFYSVLSLLFPRVVLLICILSLYRTPVLHPVTKLKPPPSRFLCDERASEFQFPSCFQCHTWISYFSFLFFFPSLVPTACILPFFFLAFSHISYISCISPFFIYRAQIFAPT